VISRFIKSRFSVESAQIDPTTGTIRLAGLQIGHPSLGDTDVLIADRIEFDVNTNPLGTPKIGSVRRVEIDNLHLHLSFADVEQWNLWDILMLPEGSGDSPPGTYPAVTISDSVVTVRLSDDLPAAELTEVNLELAPETADSSFMVLSGSMKTPEGFHVRVRGSGDASKGEFQALFEANDLPLRPRLARPYSPDAERYLERAELAGAASKVGLWVQYPPHPDDEHAVSAQLTVDTEDVSWKLPTVPYPVTGARGKVTAATRDGGKVNFDLLSKDRDRTIHARGELTQCLSKPLINVMVETTDIPVDEQLASAVKHVRGAQRTWDAFAPEGGLVDANLFVYNLEAGGRPQLSLDMNLRGVSGAYVGFPRGELPPVGFPYRLHDLNGLVQVRRDRVEFEGITGRRPDGARVRMHGSVFRGAGRIEELLLEVHADSVLFSDDLRSAVAGLNANSAELYQQFSPQGSADLHVVLRKPPGLERLEFNVEIEPLEISASYDGLPYPLDDIVGRIVMDETGATFDLSGARGAAAVQLGGRLSSEPSDGPQFELWLEGEGVPLDETLHRAITVAAPDIDEVWQEFEPTGEVNCKLTLWRPNKHDPFMHDIRLDLVDSSVAVKEFGLRLDHLGGSAFVHGSGLRNHIDFTSLRGEIDNGPGQPAGHVVIDGAVESTEDGHRHDLTTVVRGLILNDRLSASLDRAGVLSKSEWATLAPSGVIDLVSHKKKELDSAAPEHQVRVQLLNIVSSAPALRRPVTNLQGELTLGAGRGEFEQLRGKLGESAVVAAGQFRRDGHDTVVNVTLSCDEVVVDPEFAKLMPAAVERVIREHDIRGSLGVHDLAVDYRYPKVGDDFELSFEGVVIANHVNLEAGAQVQGISGTFEVSSDSVTPAGGAVRCKATSLAFRYDGHQAMNASADLVANPEEVRISDLRMRLHGGVLVGDGPDGEAMVYGLEDNVLTSTLRWDGMSLTQFMRAVGELAPVSRGTLSGDIALRMEPGSAIENVTADASVRIRNGRLGEVPIFTAIYAYLTPAKRPQFEGLSADLRIADRMLMVDNLSLTSPLVDMTGEGTISPDGYVDIAIEFPDFFAASGDWFILPQVLRAVTSQVVRFHVFGYVRTPRARPRWLFQNDPRRIAINPIPPRRRATPTARF